MINFSDSSSSRTTEVLRQVELSDSSSSPTPRTLRRLKLFDDSSSQTTRSIRRLKLSDDSEYPTTQALATTRSIRRLKLSDHFCCPTPRDLQRLERHLFHFLENDYLDDKLRFCSKIWNPIFYENLKCWENWMNDRQKGRIYNVVIFVAIQYYTILIL